MSKIVTKAIIDLFDSERFYAELIMQMDRILSDKVPTAGVCVKDNIQLYINPAFFESLTPEQRVSILKHECQHILNDHISRSKEYAPDVYSDTKDAAEGLINSAKHMLINVAADCSINPGIPHLPEGAQYPSNFNLPSGQIMEFYADALKNNEKMKQLTHYDGHDLWSESEGDKEEIKQKIQKAVKSAANNTRAAGKMSSDLELLVERLNYKPKDWKGDLRRFVARALSVELQSSRVKRNRRYGITIPGVVKEDILHIGVAIDTSGSVSDEALNQFMAEIANIAKYAKVTVVEADSEVKDAYEFNPRKVYKVKGRGGTAYQPAFKYFTEETNVDGVIYFGDMDSADRPEKPKYPVLWAIIGDQKPPASFGSSTKIEINLIGKK